MSGLFNNSLKWIVHNIFKTSWKDFYSYSRVGEYMEINFPFFLLFLFFPERLRGKPKNINLDYQLSFPIFFQGSISIFFQSNRATIAAKARGANDEFTETG